MGFDLDFSVERCGSVSKIAIVRIHEYAYFTLAGSFACVVYFSKTVISVM